MAAQLAEAAVAVAVAAVQVSHLRCVSGEGEGREWPDKVAGAGKAPLGTGGAGGRGRTHR